MNKKEIRKDLYTQTEYAKKTWYTKARINQMVKNGDLPTVHVNGTVLVKCLK